MKTLLLSEQQGQEFLRFLQSVKNAKIVGTDIERIVTLPDLEIIIKVHMMRRTDENTEIICANDELILSLLEDFAIWKGDGNG